MSTTTDHGFAIANADQLASTTQPEAVSLGISADNFSHPHPDLDGLRVKVPGRPEIYLMDQGYRRWIPDPATYNNLFRDWNGIHEDVGVDSIPVGTPIAGGAILARGSGTAPVYLVDGGVKRWITSPAVIDQYNFSWERVYEVPATLLQGLSTGPNISD